MVEGCLGAPRDRSSADAPAVPESGVGDENLAALFLREVRRSGEVKSSAWVVLLRLPPLLLIILPDCRSHAAPCRYTVQ